MNHLTVVGVQETEFKPKDSNDLIKGYNLWLGEERKGVDGLATDRVFITAEKMNGLTIEPGDIVEISYNKWGRVQSISIAESAGASVTQKKPAAAGS
jgi:hypothetical protein